MADLLDRGAAWLEQQRTRHLAAQVTYVRGEKQIGVSATIGRTRYETDDGHVVHVEFTDRDFLILAADLVLDGQTAAPRRGDLIREAGHDFEVLDWRYSDSYRRTWRITTKFLEITEP